MQRILLAAEEQNVLNALCRELAGRLWGYEGDIQRIFAAIVK